MGVPPHQRNIKWGPLRDDVQHVLPPECHAPVTVSRLCDGCSDTNCPDCVEAAPPPTVRYAYGR
jgi:hypothetical protein